MVTTDTGGLHELLQAQVSMEQEKLVIVVPRSLKKVFLCNVREEAGHQGSYRTLAQLAEVAYWVAMGSDATNHCRTCVKRQITQSPACKPASLQPVLASRPWEMVTVDILKVHTSRQGNQYVLVVQDYFSKWPFARAIPDQYADRISRTTLPIIPERRNL